MPSTERLLYLSFASWFTSLCPRFIQLRKTMTPFLHSSRLRRTLARRVHYQLRQSRSRLRMQQPQHRVREADPIRRHPLLLGSLLYHLADQIVQQNERQHFLLNALDGSGRNLLHIQRALEIAKVDFDLPTLGIKVDQLLGRILLRIQQRGDDPRPLGAKTLATDAEGNLPQRQRLAGDLFPPLAAHPRGTLRAAPFNQQVLAAQAFLEPAASLAATADHFGPRQTETAVRALPDQQRQMSKAHQAAIAQQQTALPDRLEQPRKAGELLASVGEDDGLCDESGAALHQRQQLGRRIAAADAALVGRLAKLVPQFRDVVDQEAHAVGKKDFESLVCRRRRKVLGQGLLDESLEELERQTPACLAYGLK